MAWGGNTNPVAIGAATRKVDYDDLWDKLQYVKDSVIPATTKMLFGQSTAPTGWTKDTSTWTNDSMIVFTTGSISSGGTDSPSTAHNHRWYIYNGLTSTDQTYDSGGSPADITSVSITSGVHIASTLAATSITNAAYTAKQTPKYQMVIAATKDAYT